MIMEIVTPVEIERVGFVLSGCLWIKGIPLNLFTKIVEILEQARKIAADDPRKLIHSFKVGLALTLVSLFYYFQPLYSSFGVSAMWAVMTVVVVFEFSVGEFSLSRCFCESTSRVAWSRTEWVGCFRVGATLGKGVNRGLATLAAGALGLGAHHLANVSGKTCEPILIGIFVFLQGMF